MNSKIKQAKQSESQLWGAGCLLMITFFYIFPNLSQDLQYVCAISNPVYLKPHNKFINENIGSSCGMWCYSHQLHHCSSRSWVQALWPWRRYHFFFYLCSGNQGEKMEEGIRTKAKGERSEEKIWQQR